MAKCYHRFMAPRSKPLLWNPSMATPLLLLSQSHGCGAFAFSGADIPQYICTNTEVSHFEAT